MFTKRFLSCFLFLATTLGMFAQVPDYAPEEGLQLWCSFNDPENDTNDAGVTSITVSSNQSSSGMDRLGNVNRALMLTSQQGYVTANYSGAQPIPFVGTPDGLTVNLWYKVAADSVRAILAQCYDDNATNSGGWRITWNKNTEDNTSYIEASYRNGSSDSCDVTTVVPGDFYGWHMVTFYVDVTGCGLYVDNQLTGVGVWDVSQNMITTGFANPVIIGNYNGNPAPLTSYVGKMDDVAFWNRALTAAEIDQLYTAETTIAGCTNSNSCTFNEGVTIDDGTCAFFCQGCMDPCACNYDQNATTHIAETCVYDCIVDTVVLRAFLDLNVNGVRDADEEIIANRPIRFTGADSATVYTDYQGEYLLPVRAGNYAFEIYSFPSWSSTITNAATPLYQDTVFPSIGTDTLFFGLAPGPNVLTTATAQIVSGSWDSFTCSSGYGSGLHIVNTGGEILSGLLTLSCDGVFTPGRDSSLTIGPDSTSAGYAEWYIENLMPGESGLYTFHVDGNVAEAGSLDFNMQIALVNPLNEPVYSEDFVVTPAVDCTPQPAGEISATPIGVQPGNYIQAGETITYLVQFRNTGAGDADSLRLSINLNSNEFELSTLNILYASEALIGCLHDDGTIDMYLGEGYVIPDTLTDPIDAQGYVVFEVQVKTDVAPGSTITVAPYLSMNETPIPVEPFVHRIFDCDDFFGLDDLFEDNPAYFLIDPAASTEINISVCEDSINSNYAISYSWQIDNAIIDSPCAITIETTDPAVLDNFNLMLIISNDSLGCRDTTSTDVIIPVEELYDDNIIQAFPNPFSDDCTVIFTERFASVALYNTWGAIMQTWNNEPTNIIIKNDLLESGVYYLVARNERTLSTKVLVAH